MKPWFIATERFGPPSGSTWTKYIKWSGLTQLEELVSLDIALCPTVLPSIRDDYWSHIVNEDCMLRFFVNLQFLEAQLVGIDDKNLLAVVRDPDEHLNAIGTPEKFDLLGYDLLDDTATSSLSNCGGFPEVFRNSELSSQGLLTNLSRAREVQAELRRRYPEEPHADCTVWAIFRAQES